MREMCAHYLVAEEEVTDLSLGDIEIAFGTKVIHGRGDKYETCDKCDRYEMLDKCEMFAQGDNELSDR